jgi:Lantibiotic biosynthesis dehydratase C-term
MTQENSSSWLVAYLYYDEPWERLLTEAVLPYAEIVAQTGIAESWFFVRYWERGPHIRLRFKAEADVIEKMLRSNLEEHFLNYFESVPSFRIDPSYPPRIPDAYKWLPNNSVQYDVYLPELERYGGVNGMALAEQQFALSSKIVLKSIEALGQQWSYDDALGTGIKLHLSFL